jgi:hypothetical protein
MDFATTFSSADQRAMLQRAMAAIEAEILETSSRCGLDVADIDPDTWEPTENEDGVVPGHETGLKDALAKWKIVKGKLDALA